MPATSVYALPYQDLASAPHGPNLGEDLAEAVEDELVRIDADVADVVADVAALPTVKAVVTTADHNIASSTSLTATVLTVPVLANTNYVFSIFAPYQASTVGDFKYDITFPAGASMRHVPMGPAVAQATDVQPPATNRIGKAVSDGSGVVMGGNNNTSDISTLLIEGSLRVGATAGSITFRFAQNASDATNTTLKAGAFIRLIEA